MRARLVGLVLGSLVVAVAAPALLAAPGAADWRLFPRQRRTFAASFTPPATGPVRVALFDADSTLRVTYSGAPSANGPRDVAILPLVAPRLKELAAQGWLVAIVSNQGGIASKMVTFAVADAGLRFACRQLARLGAPIHWYDFAEGYDHDRKPDTGMAERLGAAVRKAFGREVDWNASMMVGDSGYKRGEGKGPDGRPGEDVSDADRLFADNVRSALAGGRGLPWHHPRDLFGWAALGPRNFNSYAEVAAFLRAHPELDPGVNEPPATKVR